MICPVCQGDHAPVGSGPGTVPAFVCPGPPTRDVIPFPEGWARRQPVRSWWRRLFKVRDTNCVCCFAPITLLPGTTAWEQHICSTCARTTRQ